MTSQRDPAFLTPDERFREIAAILAAGVRRVRDRSILGIAGPIPENSSEASKKPLEIGGKVPLTVQRG